MAPKMLGIGEGLWNIISRCHKYFQHLWKCFNISFGYKTNVKNRKRKQEIRKHLPDAYLAPHHGPTVARPNWPLPVVSLARRQRRKGARRACMPARQLLAASSPSSALSTPESSTEPPGLSSLSPELSPLLCSSSLPRPNATAARRREPPRPSPPPRPLLLSRSTAALDYASSSRWTMPRALQRRHRRHPLRRSRGSPPLNSSPTGPPRAHRRRLRVRCELPFLLPLAP